MNVLHPMRVERDATLKLAAPPEDVFPLLCPVREVEWVEDWDPKVVYSNSGLVEQDCVFVTRENGRESIWTVTRHDPEAYRLELIKLVHGLTVGRIAIWLQADGEDRTLARVAYQYTALSAEGRDFVQGFTEAAYADFMEKRETALNNYLQKGGKLDDLEYGYE